MRYVVAACFVAVAVPVALIGLVFVFNVRNAGVRYLRWYRTRWAWTRGVAALHTARATRILAGGIGLLWLGGVCGVTVVVLHALLK
jgi:hypothetical protein